MEACQEFKWSAENAQGLTNWTKFDGNTLIIQMKPRKCTGTHSLDEI
jgi:hypothetical protein